jgi:hypothetical protein
MENSPDQLGFHAAAIIFDLHQGRAQPCLFRLPLLKKPGLRRTDIPDADKGPLEAIQPAAARSVEAAAFAPSVQQLHGRRLDAGQVHKKQILEIGHTQARRQHTSLQSRQASRHKRSQPIYPARGQSSGGARQPAEFICLDGSGLICEGLSEFFSGQRNIWPNRSMRWQA